MSVETSFDIYKNVNIMQMFKVTVLLSERPMSFEQKNKQ